MILEPINYKANLCNQAVWRAYQIIQWWRGKKGVRSKLITLILYKPQAYEYQTLYVGGRTNLPFFDKVVDRQGNLQAKIWYGMLPYPYALRIIDGLVGYW